MDSGRCRHMQSVDTQMPSVDMPSVDMLLTAETAPAYANGVGALDGASHAVEVDGGNLNYLLSQKLFSTTPVSDIGERSEGCRLHTNGVQRCGTSVPEAWSFRPRPRG